jgi:ketosteroid isomerase-like protein
MSENLDLVRSICAAWERGDYGNDEEWARPDIEWVFADGPAPASGVGFAALAEAWSDWLDAWGALGVGVEEYRELDDGRVLALIQQSVRGRASGVEVRTVGASVFNVHDGKVTRLVHYSDRRLALADLGLEQ